MQQPFDPNTDKRIIFNKVENQLLQHRLQIISSDINRPWGGFFVIDENDAPKFINLYFPHLTKEELKLTGRLSPKILIVAPGKRLSWQYHRRRAEIWKLIDGEVKLMTSDSNEEKETTTLVIGDIVQLYQGQRHRLIGAENQWGVLAEIWQHTDAENPSDEDDIVRVQDDFGR